MSTRAAIPETLADAAAALGAGQVSSVELTQATLAHVRATAELGAFLHVDDEGAITQARAADERHACGARLGPLDGVPLGLKDNILVEGLPATCGSQMLARFVAPYDATVTRRLKEAGAVLVGKLNMDEFAMGSSSEHSAFGAVRNPWDRTRVPGGSSGGSAVAVASGTLFGTLGTDTGGSIRQPAAFCGVVGLKPTYGRVSRSGVIAFASSLDQVGPMGRNVRDVAMLLTTIAGRDALDATSSDHAVDDYLATMGQGARGLRLGVPEEYFADGLESEVRAAIEAAIEDYRRLGAAIVAVSLPHTDVAVATYYLIATAEASSNLARYDGVRFGLRRDPGEGLREMYRATRDEGFGDEVKRRLLLGTFALSSGYYDAYYGRAQKVRTLIRRDFDDVFARVDAIVSPTTPGTAFRLGEHLADPIAMYLADVDTVSANLAGLPALSLPCGFDHRGLPIGLQLMGPAWSEACLLQLAYAYEREHDWHTRRPPA
ncbi:MAG: Asp-tRNA(Asn)/Glu-tRNA(Gln) amidotransferase subunit GatA [Myxococcota bacterium]